MPVPAPSGSWHAVFTGIQHLAWRPGGLWRNAPPPGHIYNRPSNQRSNGCCTRALLYTSFGLTFNDMVSMPPADQGMIVVEEGQQTVSAQRRLQNRVAQRKFRGM